MEQSLLRVFQRQIKLQCEFIQISEGKLYEALKSRQSSECIKLVFLEIQNILTATANISKCLWGSGKRKDKISLRRVELQKSLVIDKNSSLYDVEMRNHFDHFDDRIDTWWKNSECHNSADLLIGSSDMIRGIAPNDEFRGFDPNTGELRFNGKKFNLYKVLKEVGRIYPIVQNELNKLPWL